MYSHTTLRWAGLVSIGSLLTLGLLSGCEKKDGGNAGQGSKTGTEVANRSSETAGPAVSSSGISASDTGISNTGTSNTGTSNTGATTRPSQSERAASPAPMGLRNEASDTERTWRPRPVETSVAETVVPASPRTGLMGSDDDGGMLVDTDDDPADTTSSSASPTLRTPDTTTTPPPAATTPLTTTPPVTAPPTASPTRTSPAVPGVSRMSLEDHATSTRPANETARTGSAARPDSTAAATPAKMTIHTVQSGDTFSSLAAKYLGSTRHASLIAKANPKIDAKRLMVGAKVNIPPAPEAKEKETPKDAKELATAATLTRNDKPKTPAEPPPAVNPSRAYKVKAGDSWNELGKRFLGASSRWIEIYDQNKERFPRNSRDLKPGMVLELPEGATLPTAKK